MKSFLLNVLLFTSVATATDWTGFRGPHGNGLSDARNVPTTWGPDLNVAWKIDLPGRSNGSPIVSGDLVFLTSADDEGRERHLHCFSVNDGAEVWKKTVTMDRRMPTHKTNLYGGSTPATDGSHVIVWHGSAGLYCYDLEGRELWSKNFGEFRHQWGYGTSPVLTDGKIILHSGPGQTVFVAALDLKSGDVLWRQDEPVENDGVRNNANKVMGSWSTPVLAKMGGKHIAVCSMATRTNAYDLATGDIVWSCDGLRGPRGDLAYASPIIADDICIAMAGYQGPGYGFRMKGTGNITDQQQLWVEAKNPQRIGSGVFVNGFVFMSNAGPNTLQCIDPGTGKIQWQERSSGAHWGSIVVASGLLYATDQNGTTVVFEPNPKQFQPVSTNRLNDAGNSTPALADGAIFIRTFQHLYRISAP